jgi:hypothetical protein
VTQSRHEMRAFVPLRERPGSCVHSRFGQFACSRSASTRCRSYRFRVDPIVWSTLPAVIAVLPTTGTLPDVDHERRIDRRCGSRAPGEARRGLTF